MLKQYKDRLHVFVAKFVAKFWDGLHKQVKHPQTFGHIVQVQEDIYYSENLVKLVKQETTTVSVKHFMY